MKITIKQPWRNHGYSWGLHIERIYGKTPFGWAVWSRITGVIEYISPLKPNIHGYDPGEHDARTYSWPVTYENVDQDSTP